LKNPKTTREPQYQVHLDHLKEHGSTRLGIHANTTWHNDPKHLLFTLARYKFAAKMLAGKENVAELGCGDGTGGRLVQPTVSNLTITDFDPIFIDDIRARINSDWPVDAVVHDITEAPLSKAFDAVYTLDMMEHIDPKNESAAMTNIVKSLKKEGVFLVGIPSLTSQKYAHPKSLEGHVNCKDGDLFKYDLLKWFHNVFIFSMNDEVVHTGFFPMAHYLLAICCQPKMDKYD